MHNVLLASLLLALASLSYGADRSIFDDAESSNDSASIFDEDTGNKASSALDKLDQVEVHWLNEQAQAQQQEVKKVERRAAKVPAECRCVLPYELGGQVMCLTLTDYNAPRPTAAEKRRAKENKRRTREYCYKWAEEVRKRGPEAANRKLAGMQKDLERAKEAAAKAIAERRAREQREQALEAKRQKQAWQQRQQTIAEQNQRNAQARAQANKAAAAARCQQAVARSGHYCHAACAGSEQAKACKTISQ